jgi:hypothetical protein
VKVGDFVRVKGRVPAVYGRVEAHQAGHIEIRSLDGWMINAKSEDEIEPADLVEVWRVLEVEHSRIDRRLADLRDLQRAAFDQALKAGR